MSEALTERKSQQSFRTIISKSQKNSLITVDGKDYINLSSNDYLGFAQDDTLQQRFLNSLNADADAIRFSSSGSPLLTGAMPSYERAQHQIEHLFNKSCVFFNTGFGANSGVISALADTDTLILADKLSHASIIDGMGNSKGKALRFAHNDYEHLESLIQKNYDSFDNILVVTEAVFSMDGDMADIKRLVALKKQYSKVYLYIDEAHSFALYDDLGLGLCAKEKVLEDVDFILCTCGKGLGSQGAFVVCNETARDYLINNVRPLIFSTAMAPIAFEHIAFMLHVNEISNKKRERLQQISHFIHETLSEQDFENVSSSQIIPLITGENDKALDACQFFLEHGFYAMPIRHPTVPKGKARLRLSLNAGLTDNEVNKLAETIKAYKCAI